MKILTSLLFVLILASCADRNRSGVEDTDMNTTDEMETTMPDRQNPVDATRTDDGMDMNSPQAASPQLQSTIDAVQNAGGDITALQPSAATSNIDGWISKLNGMDGADGIVTDLKSLKTALQADQIDGMKVSGLMSSLADKTRSMESKAPGLSTLASALEAGADKLSGK